MNETVDDPPAGMIPRIRRTPGTALKPPEIDWLVEVRWVTPYEETFLRGTSHRTTGNSARRVAPTQRQLPVRLDINREVLARYDADRLEGGR